MAGGGPLVRMENVSKSFGGALAIDRVSLEIEAGSFFALLGPSGCGKTTLMRLIAGFESPDCGSLWIDGVDMRGVPPNLRPVNMMFQSYALFPHLTVFDNIAYGLRRAGFSRAAIGARVAEMLQLVQLPGLEARYPKSLSGGQQQRVALARALARSPKLLLLDEPMAALDRKLREETQLELIGLQARLKAAFLVVTHDQDEAMAMAATMAVMRKGRIAQTGPVAQVYAHPNSRYVAGFVGDINLFEVMVDSRNQAGLHLRAADGMRFEAHGEGSSAKVGDAVGLAVRPEFLRLSGGEATVNAMPGEVTDAVFYGQRMLYRLRLANGLTVKASVALGGMDRVRHQRGAHLTVWFAPQDAIVLTE